MSNLSELLPSGGGQNLVEFVASGTLPNGKPVVLKADGTVEVVSLGTEVPASIGSSTVFEQGNGQDHLSQARLSSTKTVVAYQDVANLFYGAACVLTISGTTITAGTPVVFNSAKTQWVSVSALSDTKAIVVYNNKATTYKGTANVLSISGTTVTVGAAEIFESHIIEYITVAALSDTKAIAVYQDLEASNRGTSVVMSISGTTISSGARAVFNTSNISYTEVAKLTSTKAIVVYRGATSAFDGYANVLDVSGTTITAGTSTVFESGKAKLLGVDRLSDTKAITAYVDDSNSNYGTVCVLGVSGSSITAGTPVVFNSAATVYTSIAAPTDSTAVTTYKNDGDSGKGTACIISVSGTTATAATPIVFSNTAAEWTSVSSLTSGSAVVAYENLGTSGKGTALVITLPYQPTNLTATNLIGITSEATSSGGTAKINTWGGINEAQTSLTIASDYYAQTDGTITTATAGQKLGTAISATTINIRDLP